MLDFAACNFYLQQQMMTGHAGTLILMRIVGNSLLPSFNNAPLDITVSCENNYPTTVFASISPFASEYEENIIQTATVMQKT